MTNLATIATETAERIPDAIAYKLDDTEVNGRRSTRAAPASPGC